MKIETNFLNWGPYLSFGADASTEMRISWNTEQYYLTIQLKYGTTSECSQLITEEYESPQTHHCVELTNLSPNTIYYYQLVTGDEERDSKVHKFTTGPDPSSPAILEPFDFVVLSDLHANGIERIQFREVFEAVKRNVKENKFFLALGDSVDDGHRGVDWEFFFETANPFLHKQPIMNTTGNHDTSTKAKYARFLSVWDHPYVNKRQGAFYKFRYGNIMFLMTDSDNGGTQGLLFNDEQMEWVEQELEAAYKENLWIFVCFHRQMYSTGDFSMEPALHQYYRPLFDQYHVDCVMYGHDHNYQVFWTDKDSDWGGSKYMVCGGSGGPVRTELKILGKNRGETIYVWPGLTYSYKRDGILPRGKEVSANINNHRMDDICKTQIYGVLTPNFVHFNIKGDNCVVRCIGFQDQPYHEFSFSKTKKN